jgi:acetylornithine deacetylase/succinyl-diaminopimelate desuccinylase-like protein
VSLTALQERVCARIDEHASELIDLCVDLGNTVSPHGQERPIAEKIAAWLQQHGVHSWLQPITADSANVVGLVPGTGDGKSLIFDAHTDTGPELSPDVPERVRRINQAWVEEGVIYGAGVANDKGQLAALMMAVQALLAADVRLAGDLYIAGVAFETGWPSVGASQGINFPGEGFGTWWLFNRGVTADYALVGETSGFGLITAECGELGLELRLHGRQKYTPRYERGASWRENPNSVVHAAHLVPAVEEWAVAYERTNTLAFDRGTIVPKAQIELLHGGASQTILHLDVRILPGANPRAVQRDLQEFLSQQGLSCEITPYQWSRGYLARGAEPLITAVTDAHVAVFGSSPPDPPTEEVSMWRDVNMFNEVGIPSICYGPPRGQEPYSDDGNRAVRAPDMVAATKVYALTAMNLCGVIE